MSGIRVVHESHKNCVVTIEIPHRPYTEAFFCPTCGIHHRWKTVHLWLDDSGGTVVSEGTFRLLQRVGMPRLMVESEVLNPPDGRIDFQNGRAPRVVREKPRITLYGK